MGQDWPLSKEKIPQHTHTTCRHGRKPGKSQLGSWLFASKPRDLRNKSLTSLSLTFPICKMGIKINPSKLQRSTAKG